MLLLGWWLSPNAGLPALANPEDQRMIYFPTDSYVYIYQKTSTIHVGIYTIHWSNHLLSIVFRSQFRRLERQSREASESTTTSAIPTPKKKRNNPPNAAKTPTTSLEHLGHHKDLPPRWPEWHPRLSERLKNSHGKCAKWDWNIHCYMNGCNWQVFM